MCLCSNFSCVLELSLVADYKTPATCCAVSQSGYCCCVNVTAAGAALQQLCHALLSTSNDHLTSDNSKQLLCLLFLVDQH